MVSGGASVNEVSIICQSPTFECLKRLIDFASELKRVQVMKDSYFHLEKIYNRVLLFLLGR